MWRFPASYQSMTLAMRLSPSDTPRADTAVTIHDAALVARARGGDAEAFERLYRTHAPRIYALSLRLTADSQHAAELTQDVFVRAWEGLSSFRGESALTSWLHRLTVNAHLMMLRAERRRTQRVALEDDLADPRDESPRPSRATASPDIEGAIDLERAIARLPRGARTAFVLHEVEGYSHEEIAALTGLAAGTLRAHLHRARRLLMEMMAP